MKQSFRDDLSFSECIRVDWAVIYFPRQRQCWYIMLTHVSGAQPPRLGKMEGHLKNRIILSDVTMCFLSSRKLKANLKCFMINLILVPYSQLSTLDILLSQQWQFGPIHNRIRAVSELTDFFFFSYIKYSKQNFCFFSIYFILPSNTCNHTDICLHT